MLDLTSLAASFKGDLVTPEDADYAQAIVRWAKNAQKNAQVVAFVKTPEDVGLAIAFAKENKLPIAIKGGGHSTAGASSSEGLVIDLSRHMRTVDVDVENKLAYVGGGATWGDVDKATIAHGLATPAGTVSHTGVAGLTLGGGIGWLSGRHGLVIDNLVQATVVNSKGQIFTASETENADLFFGIRGGGCNFGIVTQFVFKLFPQQSTVYAGMVIYTPEVLEELVKVTDGWLTTGGQDEGMFQILTVSPHGPPVPVIATILFYNGSEAEGREKFKAFLDIKHVGDTTKDIPYEQLNKLQDPMTEYGQPRLIRGAFHKKPTLESIKATLGRIAELTNAEHQPVLILEYYSLRKITSVANGNCAYVRSDANNVTSVTTWNTNTPENLATARKMARELTGIIANSQKEFFGENRGYGNYDQDGSDEIEGVNLKTKAQILFGDNYPRLQKLKQDHDPENLFFCWFPITPKA